MIWPQTIMALENRAIGVHGEATLGRALELAIQEWEAGNRDREFRLHLLFLAWYCNEEPPYLTGLDESTCPSGQLPALFSAIYETFSDSIRDDPELLYVVGLMAYLSPWALGGDEGTWEARSRDFRAWYRVLLHDGLDPSHFEGRGAYGDYFGHQVRIRGGY